MVVTVGFSLSLSEGICVFCRHNVRDVPVYYTFGELAADNIKNSGGILVILSNRVWARDFLFSSGAISQGFNELTSQRV